MEVLQFSERPKQYALAEASSILLVLGVCDEPIRVLPVCMSTATI
jgi:hypothetical protein